MIQSDMEQWAFQIQRILANELDRYKGKENCYVDDNIKEIQQLYIDEELPRKEPGKVAEDEVILVKLYEVLESILTKSSSFVDKEIDNLIKYMKFVKAVIVRLGMGLTLELGLGQVNIVVVIIKSTTDRER